MPTTFVVVSMNSQTNYRRMLSIWATCSLSSSLACPFMADLIAKMSFSVNSISLSSVRNIVSSAVCSFPSMSMNVSPSSRRVRSTLSLASLKMPINWIGKIRSNLRFLDIKLIIKLSCKLNTNCFFVNDSSLFVVITNSPVVLSALRASNFSLNLKPSLVLDSLSVNIVTSLTVNTNDFFSMINTFKVYVSRAETFSAKTWFFIDVRSWFFIVVEDGGGSTLTLRARGCSTYTPTQTYKLRFINLLLLITLLLLYL